jgi:hypothetical protein
MCNQLGGDVRARLLPEEWGPREDNPKARTHLTCKVWRQVREEMEGAAEVEGVKRLERRSSGIEGLEAELKSLPCQESR